MEKLPVLRSEFQVIQARMVSTSGAEHRLYLGMLIGLVDAVALFLDISWIQADVLLRKES